VVSGRSIHTVAAEEHAFCWDNALTPALECASGDEVEFSVRDASGGQLGESSTAADVAAPDWVVGCFVPDAIFEGG
jgi:acetamidase/formamidase